MLNPYQAQLDELEAKIAQTNELLADPDFSELAQLELIQLEEQKKLFLDLSEQYAHAGDADEPVSQRKVNCIFEIRQGAGGDEAKIWANDLLRMYSRFAQLLNFKITMIDESVFKISGKTAALPQLNPEGEQNLTAYELFKYESGVHRVQRVPETESAGRIHTSTASVAVLPEIHSQEIVIRNEDLEWQFMRASGAGGQSVNKTSSAVRLIHAPTGIMVTCSQEKKQEQNRKIALDLLRSQLWDIEEEKKEQEIGVARSVIGRAKRAEKIRTYNYPQNRITDHRTKQSWHDLPNMLEGYLEKMVLELHPALSQLALDADVASKEAEDDASEEN